MLTKRNKSPEMREIARRKGKNKGKKDSPIRIEQKRQWMTGRKHHTEEFKQSLIERNKAKIYDEQAREKMRTNARKLWDDPIKGPELRAKLAQRNKDRAKKNQSV